MNPRDQAIEVMARAGYEQVHAKGQMTCVPWDSDDPVMETVRDSHRTTAAAQLGALLAATQEEPCPTCGGTKLVGLRWCLGALHYESFHARQPENAVYKHTQEIREYLNET